MIIYFSERARIALGYDADYRNDYHICETFDEVMCDNFFDELAFLADGASEEAPTEFDQIVFQPTTFPPDARLQFDPLPKGEKMESMSPSNKAHLSALKWSKFSLETIKDNTKDTLKYLTGHDKCAKLGATIFGNPNPIYVACETYQSVIEILYFIVYWGVKLS